jgi:hypothetical protein
MKSNQTNLLGALGLLLTTLAGCSPTTATINDGCPPGQGKALDGSGTCVDLSKEIAERSPRRKPETTPKPTCPPGEKYYPKEGKCNIDYTTGF